MKIICIASAKGGVGKSTFCTEVGKKLAAMKKQVLLVDMDIGVRSLDILLNAAEKTVYNWGDVLHGNCDARKAIINTEYGVSLLAAPVSFSDDFTAESFAACIEAYKKDFDYILLDSPAGLESGFRLSVNCADECIFVTTPDAVSIRAASSAALNARALTDAVQLLAVNRFDRHLHKKICIDDIIDTVGARLIGIIPESDEIYDSLSGKKIPDDCKGSQAFLRIAKRICGENIAFRVKNI